MLQSEVIKAAGDLLSVDAFAELCEVAPRTVERWMVERRIDSVKIGGSIRIPKMELVRLLATGYRTRAL
jgi:excisionase family DNA binding protein